MEESESDQLRDEEPESERDTRQSSRIMKLRRFLLRKFNDYYFEIPLTIIKESYLQLIITGVLFYSMPQELNTTMLSMFGSQNSHNRVVSGLALFLSLAVYPLCTLVIMFLDKKTLNKPKTQKLIGVIYENLELT